jgi:hypothetical protein
MDYGFVSGNKVSVSIKLLIHCFEESTGNMLTVLRISDGRLCIHMVFRWYLVNPN